MGRGGESGSAWWFQKQCSVQRGHQGPTVPLRPLEAQQSGIGGGPSLHQGNRNGLSPLIVTAPINPMVKERARDSRTLLLSETVNLERVAS